MKNIKDIDSFITESSDTNEEPSVKVKDLISYLNKLDPETVILLDKDGWEFTYRNGTLNPEEVIGQVFHKFGDVLFIQN